MIKETKFKINYPIEIFDKTKKVNLSNKKERNTILQRSIFNNLYKNKNNIILKKRIKLLQKISEEILKYVYKKYKLEILSISAFGSSLFTKKPGDYDFLIITKGNIFTLEETSIQINSKFSKKIDVGISIKGEDNFSLGIYDLKSKTQYHWQSKIRDRTTIALYKRHIPIFGYDFLENKEKYENNVLAQVCDLITNSFNLYYNKNNRKELSENKRAKKILSRLYEASSHLETINETQKINEIRKNIYVNLQKNNISIKKAKKIFNNFLITYHTLYKDSKIENESDEMHLKSILKKTECLISKNKLNKFLPVVCKIVDKKGKTISFGCRTKMEAKDGKIKITHAEINAIKRAKNKNGNKWENYTLYCSLEPCGDCAEIISKLGFKKVVYSLADPLLNYYYRNNKCYKKTKFYRYESEKLNIEFQKIFSKIYKKEKNYKNQNKDILSILKDEKAKENILERLFNCWKYMGLQNKKIPKIINTLQKYSFNEDIAINHIRRRNKELQNKKSIYSKNLKKWRIKKVKNLAKRIKKFISEGNIVDIGGRQGDFAEELLRTNKKIKQIYVTDISPFKEESKDEKIKQILQKSKDKIPIRKDSINTAILSMVLHHMNNKNQKYMIRSISEILKAKGRIILIEDTYPSRNTKRGNSNINNFLKLNTKEKKKILAFYDWFGNRLMRNRDAIPLLYNYKTMEQWNTFFKKNGLKKIYSEFIIENGKNPDLYPPKAIMVFEKI